MVERPPDPGTRAMHSKLHSSTFPEVSVCKGALIQDLSELLTASGVEESLSRLMNA